MATVPQRYMHMFCFTVWNLHRLLLLCAEVATGSTSSCHALRWRPLPHGRLEDDDSDDDVDVNLDVDVDR